MLSEDVSLPIKSRINAFEALASKPVNLTTSANKSAPSLLDTPVSPSSKTYFPITPATPSSSTKSSPGSSSYAVPTLGRKTSLIDDWVLEDGPLPYAPRHKPSGTKPLVNGAVRHVSDSIIHKPTTNPPPLINLESSPPSSLKTAPPLPPRKASYTSLKSVSLSNSSTSSLVRSPSTPSAPLPAPPLPQRKKSDSLTVDHAYPPLSKLGISIPSRGNGSGHVPASSISSFHSVSLSSDGGTDLMTPGSLTDFVATYPVDRDSRETDNVPEHNSGSLDESFDNVSTSSVASPTASSVSNDWVEFVRRPEPPKLPKRPTPGPSSTPSSPPIAVPYAVRNGQSKPAPPPPPSRARAPPSNRSSLTSTTASSDRSSVISQATSRSSTSSYRPSVPTKPSVAPSGQLARPTPVPPAAKRRYEAVFVKNVQAQRRAAAGARERALSPPMGRKARQAAGWRGLSVDLITNPQENQGVETVDEDVGPEERLDARVVAAIWKCSKLDRAKLRDIWAECDPSAQGSLDREAFTRGMWRIDEELRKARLASHSPVPTRPPRRLASLLR